MNGKCDSVNKEKEHLSEIERGSEIKYDARNAGVFDGSTSVIVFVGRTDLFEKKKVSLCARTALASRMKVSL